MTFQFCDSMDAYTATGDLALKWDSVLGTPAFYSSAGKFGGGAVGSNGGGSSYSNQLIKNLSLVSGGTIRFGGYFCCATPSGMASQYPVFSVNGNASNGCILTVNTSGQIVLTNSGTVLATSSVSVLGSALHWIEFQCKLNGASSTATLYIDGVLQFTGTYNLAYSAMALTNVLFGYGYIFSGACYWDDIVVWDDQGSTFNTFPIGPRRISCLIPNGAGAFAQFTPSAGANYACVAQAYSGTAYVEDTSSGNKDTYATAGLGYTPSSTINAVVVNVFGLNPAADGTKSIAPVLRSAGLNATGTTHTLPGTPGANYQDAFTLDAGGSAWSASSVNSSQPGIGD